jgi:hypothetical protein
MRLSMLSGSRKRNDLPRFVTRHWQSIKVISTFPVATNRRRRIARREKLFANGL